MSISIFSSNFATPKNEQMKILYIILFIQIGWIFPLSAQKQDSIYIGTRHTLFSEILNEERKYWIYVPETKAGEKGKAYPVLYLLDGDSFFHSVVGFTRFFSSSKTSNLPPCIVVAVLNTDRTRDFTPTCSAARRDGTICPYDKPAGGGAEQFHRFLIEELRLEVENKVPANGTNFLVGHSYAGLFTLQTLSNHPESFDSYIAIDPSLWWGPRSLSTTSSKECLSKRLLQQTFVCCFRHPPTSCNQTYSVFIGRQLKK